MPRHRRIALVAAVLVQLVAWAVPATSHARTIVVTSGDIAEQITSDAGGRSTIHVDVDEDEAIADIDVFVRATHPRAGRLDMYLGQGVDPRAYQLLDPDYLPDSYTNIGSGSADCAGSRAVFDEDIVERVIRAPQQLTGLLRPVGTGPGTTLGALTGRRAAGYWTLFIDNATSTPGTLHCWGLIIRTRPAIPNLPSRRLGVDYVGRTSKVGPLTAHSLIGSSTTLRTVQRVLGPGRVSGRPATCSVSWPARGITMRTYTYARPLPRRCADTIPGWIVVTGAGWHTPRGVRIGSTVAQLRSVYPRATQAKQWSITSTGRFRVPRHDSAYALHRFPYQPFALQPTITALVRSGRVVGFGVWAGGSL